MKMFCPEQEKGQRDTVRLQNVFLHVTKECNLRCFYCYLFAGDAMRDEMTVPEFSHLWPDIVALRPRKVVFTGGEPLLRGDILHLLSDLRDSDPEHNILRCLNTNGYLITEELARRLVGLADEVRVSLDAMRERNDSIRGRGSFYAAMRALERLYAVGFEPIAMVTVTSHSLPDLEELLCFLNEKKITRIHLNEFRPIGCAREYGDWRVEQDEVRAFMRRAWERNYPDQPPLPDPSEPSETSNCGVGSFLNIMPNGDVYPCHVLMDSEFHCGNVRKQSLLEICDRNGLLGKLAAMDYKDLAERSERKSPNSRPYACRGAVYAETKIASARE